MKTCKVYFWNYHKSICASDVTVFAFNDVDGIPTSKTLLREVTTPPIPSEAVKKPGFQSFLGKKAKSSLTILIRCDLFEQPTDANDPIQNSIPLIAFYRIIVATGSSLNLEKPPGHSDLQSARSFDSMYYASNEINETSCEGAPKRVRRSTNDEVKNWNFTVGSGSGEECQPNQDFCNPSLKAGKKYTIFIRAFSDENIYEDVKLGQYRTAPEVSLICMFLINVQILMEIFAETFAIIQLVTKSVSLHKLILSATMTLKINFGKN